MHELQQRAPSNGAGPRPPSASDEHQYTLGFHSLEEEVATSLPVTGALPAWLTGQLIRVTPAQLEVGGSSLRHWFDGLAMLNAFSFGDDGVRYRSRFLETEARRRAQDGELGFTGFATDPCRSLFKRVMTLFSANPNDNVNVNVVRLGERYRALTEVPLPVEFEPETLATVGVNKFDDRLKGHVTTAHPHYDAKSRQLISYVTRFSARSSYRVYGLATGSNTRREIARVGVSEPGYMHSFGMSERFVVLAEFPFVVDPLQLLKSGRPFIDNYRWQPERGTRLIVIDRRRGELRGIYECEPLFSFHHINAFERGDELIIDLIAFEDAKTIETTRLAQLRDPGVAQPWGRPRRLRVELSSGLVTDEVLADVGMDLPRIDYERVSTHRYRYVYGAGVRSDASPWFDRVVKVDVESGDVTAWEEAGCYPGEPVFVRRPGGRGEDDGVLLSVVLDADAGRSFLLVLDAQSLGELARARAPHHIPYAFHGDYFANE